MDDTSQEDAGDASDPSARKDDLRRLSDTLEQFARERDWKRLHTPKNLAIALAVELGELLEHFQWRTDQEVFRDIEGPLRSAIEDELADVQIYLLRLSHVLGIDLLGSARRKVDRNADRYPKS